MLRTLRRRLILSHALPMLVMIPLVGLALVYVLETQVLLVNIADDLSRQAALVADMAGADPAVWQDSTRAQAFVSRLRSQLTARLMLLDPNGHLLASSDPSDAASVGQASDAPGLATALSGKKSVRTVYSRDLRVEVADVMVPVHSQDGRVVGIVRLTYRLAGVYEQFLRLRFLIAEVLLGGFLLGAVVGLALALNIERPLRHMTKAIHEMASGQQLAPLPMGGPEEIALLSSAFNSLVERLQSLEQAQRQLLANLVHELGRPLGAVRSAVQALRGGAHDDPALRQELLVGIDEELGRLRRLLGDLAHLHSQALGPMELTLRPVALGEWISRTIAPWREESQRKGLRWEASVPTQLPTLVVDPDRLAQALGNLLSNAIKYTPVGGSISVASGLTDHMVWLRVSDSGPGIAKDEKERIFSPFYRGHAAGRFPQGMGLGLTIARDLVLAHGGRLEVQSVLSRGSDFTIWLPFKPRQP